MTAPEWLMLAGGLCEAIGLFTVGIRLAQTRAFFTGRPGHLTRVGNGIEHTIRRLLRRPGRVHEVFASDSATASDTAVGRVEYGFVGSIDDRVERLQEIVQKHENAIADLQVGLNNEVTAHAELRDELSKTERQLRDWAAEGMADGLGIETFGVYIFLVGVGLTMTGVLL